ncbi:outer membrane protein assembly factor BamE [Janthinobacterium fluminis]|uniref:Outer membrane protein assembly factor BamE n=1 Tax=Janthinobacterium fluminis TaxID=2987524 RepID=A0ABT5K3N8_9BURK|nr:outer membrane protein assembly factor BamE [Janthinobacterium fluminis]MDC8759494.1 outer membrane protein assembly factor BamE [Janthinobacterium fluminis]
MRVTTALSPSFLHRIQFKAPLLAGLVCAALAVSGCASRGAPADKPVAADGAQTTSITPLQKFLWIFSPYRPVIQQGNFISEEMLAQLKVGQTREQVRFLLGTPLLTDIFHAERWDYPFRLAKGNGELTTSRVVVFFKDGKVERFEGGNLPTEKEYIARIAGPAVAKAKAEAKTEAKVDPAPAAAAPVPAPVPATPGATK